MIDFARCLSLTIGSIPLELGKETRTKAGCTGALIGWGPMPAWRVGSTGTPEGHCAHRSFSTKAAPTDSTDPTNERSS